MKRSQEFSPSSPDTVRTLPLPAQKKARTARVSHGISNETGIADEVEENEEGSWTKVEKRKAKKNRKRESQQNVSLSVNGVQLRQWPCS